MRRLGTVGRGGFVCPGTSTDGGGGIVATGNTRDGSIVIGDVVRSDDTAGSRRVGSSSVRSSSHSAGDDGASSTGGWVNSNSLHDGGGLAHVAFRMGDLIGYDIPRKRIRSRDGGDRPKGGQGGEGQDVDQQHDDDLLVKQSET